MLFEITLATTTLLVLLATSYTDIRTREVPDILSYGLIFAALGIRAIFSFELGINLFISGLLGFIVFLLLALLLYHTHQWGGGDSKLLMGMGAVIGISYPFSESSLTLLWFFIALLLLGAVYGLIWLLVLAIRRWELFKIRFPQRLEKHKTSHIIVWVLTILLIIPSLFITMFWVFIPIPIILFYLLLLVMTIEEAFFINKTSTKNLVEGDWLAEPITKDNQIILKKKTLTKSDINQLQRLKIKTVAIKEGVPFVPSFVFAYVTILVLEFTTIL